MKFDEIGSCVAVLTVCATIIICVALNTYNMRTMEFIKNGYSQKTLQGSSMFAWVKETREEETSKDNI